MKVEDFAGVHEVSSDAGIDAIMAKRYEHGLNEFWLSHDGHRVPLVAIMVNQDLACVHYFSEEGDAGLQSVGPAVGLDPRGDTAFASSPDEEPSSMPNTTVIPFSQALAAVKEFARTRKLPSCIKWLRL